MTTLTVPEHRLRWAFADGWTIARRGIAHWARQPAQVAFGVIFPIVMVLMFAYLFGGAMTVPGGGSYREFLLPGMFAMIMVFGVGETVTAVTADLAKGVTDRFRSMPMAESAMLTGRCLADLLYSAFVLVVVLLFGLLVGWQPHGGAGRTLLALGLLMLLRFALVWVGIYLGLVLSGPEALPVVQTVEFPLGFLANLFVAPATMPAVLGVVADWNPLSSTVSAARELFGNPGWGGESWIAQHAVLMAVVWPLALVAIFLPLSLRRYRRLDR
ncbi:ABC transporter permease [Amycolatopsis nigrescens]|uniref:ABC transporter permease n=1 Tax=Amycolatopsis nigrescens TaxID=381445 RepID=UPI000380FD3E|nr:ABC transporter permease [Amycolatopsis nigrescens]